MRSYAIPAVALFLLVAACTTARSRAETAIAQAEEALRPISTEAQRVVPDQLKSLTDAVAVAKDMVTRREYDSATAMVQDVPTRTDSLAQAIVREKSAITSEMNVLNVAMPRNLAALKSKVDELSGRRRLPRDLTPEKLDSVRATYTEGMEEWPRIMAAYNAGELHDAVTRATALKQRVSIAMEAVGLVADARAWSNEASPN